MLSRDDCAVTPIYDVPLRPHRDRYAPTHIVSAVNVRLFRELLKQAREGKALRTGKLGRPALSKLTAGTGPKPVNPSTIKNIEDGKNADPGIATISRIVEAMGLTLSSFFARIERQTESDLLDSAIPRRTTPSPAAGVQTNGPSRSAVSLDASKLLAAGNALVDAGGLFIAAAEGVEVGPIARQTRPVRGTQPKKNQRGAANR